MSIAAAVLIVYISGIVFNFLTMLAAYAVLSRTDIVRDDPDGDVKESVVLFLLLSPVWPLVMIFSLFALYYSGRKM